MYVTQYSVQYHDFMLPPRNRTPEKLEPAKKVILHSRWGLFHQVRAWVLSAANTVIDHSSTANTQMILLGRINYYSAWEEYLLVCSRVVYCIVKYPGEYLSSIHSNIACIIIIGHSARTAPIVRSLRARPM